MSQSPAENPRPEPNRTELDPVSPSSIDPAKGPEAPPETPKHTRADDPVILAALDGLIARVGGNLEGPQGVQARYVKDLLVNALKLIPDNRSTGEVKLITSAVKELRYAYRVFGQYPEPHKITIFGSARTPKDHPDYIKAVDFSRLMAERGWMAITGAGPGIMEAGIAGPGREKSFGVGIRLPFEQTANDVIAGDSKMIVFRYFFTRKLMFISQAEAVALFPGGFGTMDEGFETLTLIQTGKAGMVPIVCLQGDGSTYWEKFDLFVREELLARKLISPEDLSLYTLCKTAQEAADVIEKFYRCYHSSRYVKDDLVIRLKYRLKEKDIADLNNRFARLIKKDGAHMHIRGPFELEDDHLDLPRLVFTHTRHGYGMVRQLIDAINACDPA